MPVLIIAFLVFLYSPVFAETGNISGEQTITISFDRVSLASLIDMVYSDVLKESYLIHSEVIHRSEQITVRLRSTFNRDDLPGFMSNLLRSYGIQIENNRNYIYFRPVVPIEPNPPELVTFMYIPRYRDSSYLLSLLSPVFKDGSASFSNKRKIQLENVESTDDTGLNKLIDKGADGLLFTGTQEELDKFISLIPQVDTPAKQVQVRAYVYEVSYTDNDSTGISLAFNLLKGKLGLVLGAARTAGQFLTFNTDNVDAVFSIFNSDTRFKVLSSPSVLVRSGESSRFTVGTETPVLGGISYPGQGSQPVQNVEYRQSGIIFEVKPKVFRDRIDFELFQQISDFVPTVTGVSSSPTLLKRDLSSKFSMKSGQIVVIAGLMESKRNHDSTYFPFTDFEISSDKVKSKREILLFLHSQVVEDENLDATPIADGYIYDLKYFNLVF
jgi:type II secretory pathway component GspD/PulD (secretin)